MNEPANFSNETLDGLMADWLASLALQSVRSIMVLGPGRSPKEKKEILVLHPPKVLPAAQCLRDMDATGDLPNSNPSPLVNWFVLAGDESAGVRAPEWAPYWRSFGYRGAMRIAFEIVACRFFECYLFCDQGRLSRDMQAALVWSTLSTWPKIRYLACSARSPLSVREAQCLRLAFEGLTAHETAEVLGCGDRTVNFHLSNAMAKLDAHNKLEAIQKACWLGVL